MEHTKIKQLLLDVAELNEKKYTILRDMARLEYEGNIGKEFSDLVDSYEIVNWYLNKKLGEADLADKNVLCTSLALSNQDIFDVDNFMDIIKNIDQVLPLRRVICDLGGEAIRLYSYETETKKEKNNFSKIMKNTENEAEMKLKCDMINAYMAYDFTNMMFSIIMKEIEKIKSDKVRPILVALKYNLIYISNDLENMAIKNKFKFSDVTTLVDEKTISQLGLTKDEYLECLNDVFGRLLEDSVYDAVDRVNDDQLPTLEYTDHILIKTVANLITDKRICDYMVLEPTDEMEPNIRKATMLINLDLLESKKIDSYNRKKLVK